MPVDYSKWDALELSDDSDIEVHPNVDKRSFIRAKQNQIHMEREQRKHQISTLKYERIINQGLMKRLGALRDFLVTREPDVQSGSANAAEVAFQSVIATGPKDPKDDMPPPRPDGVHGKEEPLPSYTKMMMTVLDRVNEALKGKELEGLARYHAIVEEVKKHINEVENLQGDLEKKLGELENQEKKKITSESYHTGFDSTFVAKGHHDEIEEKGKGKATESTPELLNPDFDSKKAETSTELEFKTAADTAEEGVEASPDAKRFAKIKMGKYTESFSFLSSHPHVVSEKETDGLLIEAFDAALRGENDYSLQCVHQALLLQYCRALGRDGVPLFFKRVSTEGRARDMFTQDVRDTHAKIRNRAAEISKQREAEGSAGGIEQIQLHAVEPGTTIMITIPEANAPTEEGRKARAVFDKFDPDLKKALESGSLDEVNKVLGAMPCEEAEEVVALLGEAGCLSVEEQIIDATTEEGQKALKEMEKKAKMESEELAKSQPAQGSSSEAKESRVEEIKEDKKEQYPDPE